MRLNRVLLLAATISIMMFALVFTISCSGDDGKNGRNGTSCTVDQDDNGDWNIICDGDQVGVMHNGDGPDGKQGVNGKDGVDGENCWLTKIGNGYEVRCGAGSGTVKGSLEGCSVEADLDNEYLVVLKCGKTPISMCKTKVFDASKHSCGTDGTVEEGGVVVTEWCGGIEFDPAKQSCGYGPGDKERGAEWPTTLYSLCGEEKPHEEEWNPDEYCRYYSQKVAHLVGIEDPKDWCNGEPLNKDTWKGQYCGYANQDTKVRTVLTGICDQDNSGEGSGAEGDGVGPDEQTRGPNEIAFGQGYCMVKYSDREKNITTYSESLCGTSENNKPNNGAWKGEYCGFASGNSVEPTKVYQGICDDSIDEEGEVKQAPHLDEYNKGYCLSNRYGRTVYTEEGFCDDGGKPNEWSWKGEYCGAPDATSSETILYSGLCDDDRGPNEEGWNPNEYCQYDRALGSTLKSEEVCENGDRINEGSWKGEYCGHASANAPTSAMTGACDDTDAVVGPNSETFNGGYCEVKPEDRLTGKATFSDNFCYTSSGPKTINEGKWKSEYCGFSNANSDDNDKVWTGACDDGHGKNEDEYNKTGYCKAEGPETGTVWSDEFCMETKPFNSGSWKGEYCFVGGVAKCNAGLKAKTGEAYNATPAIRCILPAAEDRCEVIAPARLKSNYDDPDQVAVVYSKGKCIATVQSALIIEERCANTDYNPTKDGLVQGYCSTTDASTVDAGDCKTSAAVSSSDVTYWGVTVGGLSATSTFKNKCGKVPGATYEKVNNDEKCYYSFEPSTTNGCKVTVPTKDAAEFGGCDGSTQETYSVCTFTP